MTGKAGTENLAADFPDFGNSVLPRGGLADELVRKSTEKRDGICFALLLQQALKFKKNKTKVLWHTLSLTAGLLKAP